MFAKDHPDLDYFPSAFLRGYEKIRPLTDTERAVLPEFELAAGVATVEMVHTSPIENDHPRALEWFDSVVHWLRNRL